jgi:hypothetical protein
MAKKLKSKNEQDGVQIDPRKLRELRRLLKVKTEEEAVRIAIEESLLNHRAARSLSRFLDSLAQEQPAPQS